MNVTQRFEFSLNLSAEKCLDYYRGVATHVVARSAEGVTLQFPASLLTPFITPSGIHGRFVMTCDEAHRGAELRRIGG